MSNPLHKTQRDVVKAVKALFARNKAELEPRLHAAVQQDASYAIPEVRNVQVAQNTLRTCLEAVLDECAPHTQLTCGELAIRLASYALSAAPLEDQDQLMAWVIDRLPAAHLNRLAKGVIIKTGWRINGIEHENVPGGRA